VRAASWVSVLAGATAGIGYGAHGVWMWATTRGTFEAIAPSLEPFFWTDALALPGALDISLLARLFRDHRMHRLDPAQHLVPAELDPVVRAAADPLGDLLVVYLPFAIEISIDLDLTGYEVRAWDLSQRAPLMPDFEMDGGRTVVSQTFSQSDQVLIAERRP
jgi:hypothetical protein